MYDIWLYSLASVFIVSAVALIGIVTLAIHAKKLQTFLEYFVSFAAGALFGDVFLHLLPEVAEETGFTLQVSLYIIAGIIIFFFIEKVIRQHRHHLLEEEKHDHKHVRAQPFAIMNLIGDAMHNFVDGMLIAGSYLVSIPVGIATTLAVIFHEIPQEIGDFGVLLKGGFSRGKALMFNFITALTSVLGAVIALVISAHVPDMTSWLIPFTAGGFIYIAGSDLLPELLHKEENAERLVLLILAFCIGVAIMASLLFFEPGHGHALAESGAELIAHGH